MQVRRARLPLFVITIAAALLAGCAQIPRHAFNAAAATNLRKVVVTQDTNQDEYDVNMVGHPGLSFGLIGGLVAAADLQSKTTQLTKAIDPSETRLQERFCNKLAEHLRSAGYDTEVVLLPKDSKEDQALALAKQRTGSDAVVFVQMRAGYWAAGPSTDYFPRIIAKVKALDTRSDKVLYEDTITYGYTMPQLKTVHLASQPGYRFKNIDDLVAHPAQIREGLYEGIEAVAGQIAADLKRQ
jgi:hypothetical protein